VRAWELALPLALKVAATVLVTILWCVRLFSLMLRTRAAQSASGPYPDEAAKEKAFRYFLTRDFYPGAIYATVIALLVAAIIWNSEFLAIAALFVGTLCLPLWYRLWRYGLWVWADQFENPRYTLILVALGLILVLLMLLYA